jgi:hypothetical protein
MSAGNSKRKVRRRPGSARRPKVAKARWHHAPNGKQIPVPGGSSVMRLGGDIAVIRENLVDETQPPNVVFTHGPE